MSRRLLCSWVLLWSLLVGACAPTSTPMPSPTATTPPTATAAPMLEEWRNRWLQGIPCRAPCWEGVTPGETSVDDALRIWAASPLIRDVRRSRVNLVSDQGQLVWNWTTGGEGGQAQFLRQDTNPKITGTGVALPWTYSLEEVIAAYGKPTHVVAHSRCFPDALGAEYNVAVYFLTNGFLLGEGSAFTPDTMNQPLIRRKDSQRIAFFPPVRDFANLNLPGVSIPSDWVVPWKDSFRLGDYLRDETNPRCFARTPTPP